MALACAAFILCATAPAGAQRPGTGNNANCVVVATPQGAQVRCVDPGSSGSGGGSGNGSGDDDGGSTANCHAISLTPSEARDQLRRLGRDPAQVQDGDTWYAIACSSGGQVMTIDVQRTGRTGPDIPGLIREAEAALVVPEPALRLAPPDTVFHLVGIPTWLAIDPVTYQAAPSTKSDRGVTITVTATPTEIRWNPGDGTPPFTCDGSGRIWQRGMREGTSDCTHTFQRSSTSADAPDAQYTLTVTTTWSRVWRCTPGCGSGPMPAVTRTTTAPLTVRQAQAVITGT